MKKETLYFYGITFVLSVGLLLSGLYLPNVIAQPLTTMTTTRPLKNSTTYSLHTIPTPMPAQITISTTDTDITLSSSTTTKKKKELRYNFTKSEIYLMAQLICGDETKDGDGEYDFVGAYKKGNYYNEMAKVLCVIMNRQRSKEFPNNIRDIILQKNQFTPIPRNLKTKPSKIAIQEITKWCDSYNNYEKKAQVIPKDHLYFRAGPNNTNITRKNYK